MLLTDIDENLYRITSGGVVTFVGNMDHLAKGLAFVAKPPADFDADGKNDIGVYRNGIWYILPSSDAGVTVKEWGGLAQDVPVPADYDGDGRTDIAVYREGLWLIRRSSDGLQTVVGWGLAQDVPLN